VDEEEVRKEEEGPAAEAAFNAGRTIAKSNSRKIDCKFRRYRIVYGRRMICLEGMNHFVHRFE